MEEVLNNWPDKNKEVAQMMREEYGEPDEMTSTQLTWFNNGVWKKTILRNEEVPHDFPKPHKDILEQVINYKVPVEKFSELAEFDGSVTIERTKGEMSARCDMEAANYLALNLAHEIIQNEKTVDEARREYAKQLLAKMMKKDAHYMKGLHFEVSRSGTNDPDESVISETLLKKAKEGAEDAWKDVQASFGL